MREEQGGGHLLWDVGSDDGATKGGKLEIGKGYQGKKGVIKSLEMRKQEMRNNVEGELKRES